MASVEAELASVEAQIGQMFTAIEADLHIRCDLLQAEFGSVNFPSPKNRDDTGQPVLTRNAGRWIPQSETMQHAKVYSPNRCRPNTTNMIGLAIMLILIATAVHIAEHKALQ
ncbi:hypothetical protein B0H66DRAFT_538392 [Apodospora peruviana]|uniref:Uncharacterized protein n=1 Tax=Apodospora peruviana TaxID=516989 RepID=A0AAE0HT22_9PEZI|nr:hypothetical protein B0H66DRAFT_538392 [Apodospora peruviana]